MSEFNELLRANPFYEFTVLLSIAAVAAFIGQWLKQPIIVAFIAVGILVGPSGLDTVHSDDSIALLAQLGIAILLFLVGLKLDVKLIRKLGFVALATGLGQVIFTSVVGFFLCLALGFDAITSLYVSIALTFSSTIIIVKMLSDKREVDSLHGRIALGFLIVQDVVVVIALVVLSAIGVGQASDSSLTQLFSQIILGAIVMLMIVFLFIRYIANVITKAAARSSELMLVFAVGLACLFATLGHLLGFSKELGGLLAGVALASTPYRESIVTKLSSLRDFLLLFFFIALGSQIDLSALGEHLFAAIVLSVFVLIGNPIIVMIIMGILGYRRRTGFLAGLTVAQISEFSLIFVAMGIAIGHLHNSAIGLVTLVGLITIALSVYMIANSHRLYDLLSPWLRVFERENTFRESNTGEETETNTDFEVLVCGAGRYGSKIIDQLSNTGYALGVVDFNPEKYEYWRQREIPCFYGDLSDDEFISTLPLKQLKWLVVTLPRDGLGSRFEDPRKRLLLALQLHGFKGKLAMASEQEQDANSLSQMGVDLVLSPFSHAANEAVRLLLHDETNKDNRTQVKEAKP
ncbi:sodium:proton exchanger [Alteromonas sediminis]|uniref:Sodium:proton exchanger n=1 Tax=Alteromonas sediminis TaxID=2259342 RepID=A0A3N5XZU7_9ALTE|nr:sodium:proton exchanger [Alteromonas sediminis]